MKPLRIHLIGDKKTKKSALDYLAVELAKFYPKLVSVRVAKKRYDTNELTIKNGGLIKPSNSKKAYICMNYLDGQYRPFLGDDYLLILSHWSFCVEHEDRFEWYEIKNKSQYSGTAANKDDGPMLNNFVVVGGDNSASKNNLTIAAHELFHIFRHYKNGIIYGSLDHCEGIIYLDGALYNCLMNPIEQTSSGNTIKKVGLKFCETCQKKFKNFYK